MKERRKGYVRNDNVPPTLDLVLYYTLVHPVGGDERYIVRERVLSSAWMRGVGAGRWDGEGAEFVFA